jgi:hypothetical protein
MNGNRDRPRKGSSTVRMEGANECERSTKLFGICQLLQKVYVGLQQDYSPTNMTNSEGYTMGVG